jgi:hypothetical protein
MKKTGLMAIIILLFATLSPLAADTSDYYPVKVVVLKIYTHADGYEVIYQKGVQGTAVAYLPMAWFVPGGKGELVKATDPAFPYLVVFYREGKFDHLRLYAPASLADPSWGVLAPSEGAGKFNVEDIKLEF